MPQRTNAFQTLVLRISQHFASSSTLVVESAMLIDRDAGTEREIDILLKDKIGAHEVLVGIECTARSKPVGLKEMEQLWQKHRSVGIQKTVIVSSKGFTRSARNWASAKQIGVVSLAEALAADWPKQLENFKTFGIGHLTARITGIEFPVTNQSSGNGFEAVYPVYVCESGTQTPVADFIHNLLKGRSNCFDDFVREARSSGASSFKRELRASFQFAPPLELRDRNGINTDASYLDALVELQYAYHDMPMRYVKYEESHLVLGESEGIGAYPRMVVAISPADDRGAGVENGVRVSINLESK